MNLQHCWIIIRLRNMEHSWWGQISQSHTNYQTIYQKIHTTIHGGVHWVNVKSNPKEGWKGTSDPVFRSLKQLLQFPSRVAASCSCLSAIKFLVGPYTNTYLTINKRWHYNSFPSPSLYFSLPFALSSLLNFSKHKK